jgi:hypothetical protein
MQVVQDLYVEDVFSTYLVTGTGTAPAVNNGIDLSGEGGLVWLKKRSAAGSHDLFDTARGANTRISTNTTNAEDSKNLSFTSTGFSNFTLDDTIDYASWTFRKAEKFFDVVTYTGNGVAGRTVAHNLDSTPGFIVVKQTSASGQNWKVWHQSVNGGNAFGAFTTAAFDTTQARFIWGDNAAYIPPTSTTFTVSNDTGVNASSATYVAYLFASDAGGFGDDGSESIIKCGSYTGNGIYLGGPEVDLGFEPQWLLIKSVGTENWRIADNMRGIAMGTAGAYLSANLSNIEAGSFGAELQATGFKITSNNADLNSNGQDYIYIAIRRPMKTPESGTEVFAVAQRDTVSPIFEGGFPVDAAIIADVSGAWSNSPSMGSRLTGTGRLSTSNTNAESSDGLFMWDYMNGWGDGSGSYPEYYSWMFKRATGFFDVVAYTGDGTASRQITHNLGAAPELLIVKCRSASNTYWETWQSSLPDNGSWASNVALNSTEGYGGFQRFDGAATQTAAYWTTGNNGEPNTSGQTYISYLFATLAGVSKVGSYTGTAADLNVDCGFSAGARFILIKRTDSTGDWYVWDSERGIVAGNDPYFLLNSNAAQVTNTDYIDPLSSGFTVTSSAPAALNASSGTYIFLAIA